MFRPQLEVTLSKSWCYETYLTERTLVNIRVLDCGFDRLCNFRKISLFLWVSGLLSDISIEQDDVLPLMFWDSMDELTSKTF